MPRPTKQQIEKAQIKIMGYHEFCCSTGYRQSDIEDGYRAGWRDARLQMVTKKKSNAKNRRQSA